MMRRTFLAGILAIAGCSPEQESVSDKDEWATRERWREAEDLFERLAREAEPAAREHEPELLKNFLDEQRRQSEGYSVQCWRHADFLTVEIKRLANPAEPQYPGTYRHSEIPPRDFSQALNLAKTRSIKRTNGHQPDQLGELRYEPYEIKGDLALRVQGFLADGWKLEARPQYPKLPCFRSALTLDAEWHPQPGTGGAMILGNQRLNIQYKTENYARPAEDDQIRFEGIGATLFVPAGMGISVESLILRTIG